MLVLFYIPGMNYCLFLPGCATLIISDSLTRRNPNGIELAALPHLTMLLVIPLRHWDIQISLPLEDVRQYDKTVSEERGLGRRTSAFHLLSLPVVHHDALKHFLHDQIPPENPLPGHFWSLVHSTIHLQCHDDVVSAASSHRISWPHHLNQCSIISPHPHPLQISTIPELSLMRSSFIMPLLEYADFGFMNPVVLVLLDSSRLRSLKQRWSHYCPIEFAIDLHRHQPVTEDVTDLPPLHSSWPNSMSDIDVIFSLVLILQCVCPSNEYENGF